MLCAFQRDADARHQLNLSLLPVRDGNETGWCWRQGPARAVSAGYAIMLSALYVPVFMMLLALVARGMAIEYRHYARRLFDDAGGGSLLASIFRVSSLAL
jgi:cytochrome d ubiquinol oxidase subunit II